MGNSASPCTPLAKGFLRSHHLLAAFLPWSMGKVAFQKC